MNSNNWITPCVLEQYNFYVPVNSSAASLIKAYLKIYNITNKTIYLEKARSLANTAIVVQNKETGHAPTYWSSNLLEQEGWMNASMHLASALLAFDEE